MENKRSSGILLPVFSLPSSFGIGDLGPEAYRFIDLLSAAGQSYWQILPINPTLEERGYSPYSSPGAFAGNPSLISPEILLTDGLINRKDLESLSIQESSKINFSETGKFKNTLLKSSYSAFVSGRSAIPENEFGSFRENNSWWVDDYALFEVLTGLHQTSYWKMWPVEERKKIPAQTVKLRNLYHKEISEIIFIQFLFYRQWKQLKQYAAAKNIGLIGDIPFYVDYNSSDVWGNQKYFKLDWEGNPLGVAGVPPDYYSKTGQLWGNPVYNWKALKNHNYSWWIRRISHQLKWVDILRLDHFRAFSRYWQVPPGDETAETGSYQTGPGESFFYRLREDIPNLPLIAEDLGDIDRPVRDLIEHFGFPGMNVLQFAFGDDFPNSSFLPHNNSVNSVVYTGTHDNNTTLGWFMDEAHEKERERVSRYAGMKASDQNISAILCRLAAQSPARTAIYPLQDILALGRESRINLPGTSSGNWTWKLQQSDLTESSFILLKDLTDSFGR